MGSSEGLFKCGLMYNRSFARNESIVASVPELVLARENCIVLNMLSVVLQFYTICVHNIFS